MGRLFFGCAQFKVSDVRIRYPLSLKIYFKSYNSPVSQVGAQCNFFQWADEYNPNASPRNAWSDAQADIRKKNKVIEGLLEASTSAARKDMLQRESIRNLKATLKRKTFIITFLLVLIAFLALPIIAMFPS